MALEILVEMIHIHIFGNIEGDISGWHENLETWGTPEFAIYKATPDNDFASFVIS